MIGMFLKHKYLAGAIIGLLSLSIICQIIMGVLFHIMIRESGNMPATKNKSLKKCTWNYKKCIFLFFQTCYSTITETEGQPDHERKQGGRRL